MKSFATDSVYLTAATHACMVKEFPELHGFYEIKHIFIIFGMNHFEFSMTSHSCTLKPSSHRRCRRDSTVELSFVGVGGVCSCVLGLSYSESVTFYEQLHSLLMPVNKYFCLSVYFSRCFFFYFLRCCLPCTARCIFTQINTL